MKKLFIFSFVLVIVIASAFAAKLPLVSIPNQPELDGKQQVAGKNVITNVDINKLPYSILQKQSVVVSYKSSTETCPPPIQIIESIETQTCPINIFSTTDTTTVHVVPVQNAPIALNQPESGDSSPTGAVVFYESEKQDNTGIAITVIIFLCITSLILITKGTASNKTRVVFAAIVIIIMAFALTKAPQQGPTGYTVQEFEEPEPEALAFATGCVLVSIPGQQPDVICPREAPECSDGMDNDDFEDALIDFPDDPGCSGPDDDLELDMLEYDDVVIDNQIDVYDIVNWIQYFNGDFTVLVDCTSPTCTNQIGTANCVGDTDPDNSGGLSAADNTFLQTTQLADTDSRTVPGASPICFNPT